MEGTNKNESRKENKCALLGWARVWVVTTKDLATNSTCHAFSWVYHFSEFSLADSRLAGWCHCHIIDVKITTCILTQPLCKMPGV